MNLQTYKKNEGSNALSLPGIAVRWGGQVGWCQCRTMDRTGSLNSNMHGTQAQVSGHEGVDYITHISCSDFKHAFHTFYCREVMKEPATDLKIYLPPTYLQFKDHYELPPVICYEVPVATCKAGCKERPRICC